MQDGDGRIDAQELCTALQSEGIQTSVPEAQEIIAQFDRSRSSAEGVIKDSLLDKSEFAEMVAQMVGFHSQYVHNHPKWAQIASWTPRHPPRCNQRCMTGLLHHTGRALRRRCILDRGSVSWGRGHAHTRELRLEPPDHRVHQWQPCRRSAGHCAPASQRGNRGDAGPTQGGVVLNGLTLSQLPPLAGKHSIREKRAEDRAAQSGSGSRASSPPRRQESRGHLHTSR